jgi:hypothetical protein
MLHPDEFPWTRNIVVASGYGLQLRKELQGDVPPFRDAYQTALFFTTLVALAPNAKTPTQADVDKRMSPRIFEIGRNHAYGLDRDGGEGDCHWENPLACDSIHPEPMEFVPPWLRTGLWLYLPAAILALVLLLPIYARHKRAAPERDLSVRLPVLEGDAECGIERRIPLDVARELLARRRTRALRYFVYVSVALVPLLHVAAVLLLGSTDEPITFYEGISVWPSEALRIYAGVLAVFLTYWAMLRMEGNQLELTQWFFPRCRDHGIPEFEFNRLPVRRSLWVNRTPQNLLRIFAGNLLETQPDNDPQAPIRAKEFWCQCAFHSSLAPTLIRTFFASVVFCAFSFIFVWIVGIPHTPYRGEASKIVDYVVVLLVSTPPLVFLTFYVVDATLVCKRFISALTERHAEWPDNTCRHFGATALDERLDAAARDIELAYDDWIDIQLIARRTAAVGSLVYYPVVVMLVLFFARSTLFDNWH